MFGPFRNIGTWRALIKQDLLGSSVSSILSYVSIFGESSLPGVSPLAKCFLDSGGRGEELSLNRLSFGCFLTKKKNLHTKDFHLGVACPWFLHSQLPFWFYLLRKVRAEVIKQDSQCEEVCGGQYSTVWGGQLVVGHRGNCSGDPSSFKAQWPYEHYGILHVSQK